MILPAMRPKKIEIMKRSNTEDLSFLVSIAPLQQTYIPNITTQMKRTAGLNVEKIWNMLLIIFCTDVC